VRTGEVAAAADDSTDVRYVKNVSLSIRNPQSEIRDLRSQI